jgi:protocatechuate 3,4-dioxygenase alpha subunit
VLDGAGDAVRDAMVEIWQANAAGRYDHPEDTQEKTLDPHFNGFGRCATDGEGYFRFRTITPGSVYGRADRAQAPHIKVSVFARGLLNRLVTRIYFSDHPMNAGDPVLATIPAARRQTIIAQLVRSEPERVFRFDIHLQGPRETVFLDL